MGTQKYKEIVKGMSMYMYAFSLVCYKRIICIKQSGTKMLCFSPGMGSRLDVWKSERLGCCSYPILCSYPKALCSHGLAYVVFCDYRVEFFYCKKNSNLHANIILSFTYHYHNPLLNRSLRKNMNHWTPKLYT